MLFGSCRLENPTVLAVGADHQNWPPGQALKIPVLDRRLRGMLPS
jgi:hypothetical protein